MARGVWKSSKFAALMLAGAAVFAAPVAAQERDHGRGNHDQARGGGGERDDAARARGNRPWAANPAPQPTPQGARPAREERAAGEWRGRPIEAQAQPQSQYQPQPRSEGPRWSPPAQAALPAAPPPPIRDAAPNRSYVDPGRDRSYGTDGRGPAPRPQASNGVGADGRGWNNSPRDGRDERGGQAGRPAQGQTDRRWDNDRRSDSDRRWDNDRRWDSNRAPQWSSRQNGWSTRGDRDWDRQWRQDRRFDWQGWRSGHRDIYRMSRYAPPYRAYAYRRLGIGFLLDGGFFATRYWIADPWTYRLPPAYGPYRWVRYYDDAMMVNIYTGEVVDVIYDFFW